VLLMSVTPFYDSVAQGRAGDIVKLQFCRKIRESHHYDREVALPFRDIDPGRILRFRCLGV